MPAVKEGLTRKRLLKRAGVGAAAMWAAPVLSSTASAAANRVHWCGNSDGAYCQPACAFLRACKPADNPNCGCFPKINTGTCFCGDILDNDCGSFADCVGGNECPDGYGCVLSCCGTGKCLPHCTTPGGARVSGVKGSGAGQQLVRS
jgi:hypothetical protein